MKYQQALLFLVLLVVTCVMALPSGMNMLPPPLTIPRPYITLTCDDVAVKCIKYNPFNTGNWPSPGTCANSFADKNGTLCSQGRSCDIILMAAVDSCIESFRRVSLDAGSSYPIPVSIQRCIYLVAANFGCENL
ncbi:hypothetical protein DFA_11243 [Cavenderia fasciculata]|uniref:Uncharacterized protein n=1 Tax=Cavenderia fasciculata TaxID=261658 RepID=F4QFM9_CACFS|nr:uncharacterized protein DFA_11243 [Cavenderia fasciculata]EGG13482.1 hypothetical protein DFA_11243 [Cavenderia fasciculata]|eukprot:XP_004350186.1 hypothetical protein DFA_11243 [Cavenderia fasciculata]